VKLLIVSLGLALAAGGASADPSCRPDVVEIRGDWGQAAFTVEVADDPQEKMIGLMNRPVMPRFAGMLFVYDHPQGVVFWMKNTLIPLDMLFVDSAGTVETIHPNAIPHDETPIPGGADIQFVLEINGGLAAALGITPGSQLRHPSIPQDTAAWSCG